MSPLPFLAPKGKANHLSVYLHRGEQPKASLLCLPSAALPINSNTKQRKIHTQLEGFSAASMNQPGATSNSQPSLS